MEPPSSDKSSYCIFTNGQRSRDWRWTTTEQVICQTLGKNKSGELCRLALFNKLKAIWTRMGTRRWPRAQNRTQSRELAFQPTEDLTFRFDQACVLPN